MIALLVMTDGRRECIERTIPSFLAAVDRPDLLAELWIHDDSADPEYVRWLEDTFAPRGFRIISGGGRSGFGGAIRSAWHHLRAGSTAPYVFHLEDDFIFPRTVPLSGMVDVLDHHPHLVQMALRRQPWNVAERAVGGIVEQHPGDYIDAQGYGGHQWLEHRRFFTTNPCLYRRALIDEHDWPDGADSEGRFGIAVNAAAEVEPFAFWGARGSGEWCEHIGLERVGTGY
jgi:hypothetical protein